MDVDTLDLERIIRLSRVYGNVLDERLIKNASQQTHVGFQKTLNAIRPVMEYLGFRILKAPWCSKLLEDTAFEMHEKFFHAQPHHLMHEWSLKISSKLDEAAKLDHANSYEFACGLDGASITGKVTLQYVAETIVLSAVIPILKKIVIDIHHIIKKVGDKHD